MQALPHRYRVKGAGRITGDVELTAERLTVLQSAPPAEFDGPGDRWSPETLLVGAVADCFILTFRAIAAASRLSWTSLDCEVTGTLDRVDRVTHASEWCGSPSHSQRVDTQQLRSACEGDGHD